ncbi:hypothetical protein HXX76_000935 [Chlamydomonas incerta]|uniref:Exportin-5 C-terminal domain-containing protein n=1 Tax=Chlamydomonas incerta TaxID=51695 RepID=A0A836B3I5_CHLIN|nr:hypothetical protein HXX76_000935 [Chlamydomonas incerta]|eukprot:KAG2446348.1 hypothetical protein HXX76_000935 [Chlamydomonas incerta]
MLCRQGLRGAVSPSGDGAAPDVTSTSGAGGAGAADGPDVTSKRAFLSALTASAPTVFPFLCEILEKHFQAAQQLEAAGTSGAAGGGAAGASGAATTPAQRAEAVAAHVAALSAALGALATWVEWVPMRRLKDSPVVGACSFFIRMGTPSLRMQALDILRQITWRKRSNESAADYGALMDAVGGGLLQATQALGLLLRPADPLPPAMVRELGHGGAQCDFGSRLLEVVEGLGEGHFRCLAATPPGASTRDAFLAQLLTLTRHPYLRLSCGTLMLWQQLLREAAPQHALADVTTVAGQMRSQGSPGAGKAGGAGGPSGGYALPVETVSELMRVVCGALPRVVPSADPGVNNVPDWADSHQEYKEVVVAFRSQAKGVLRFSAALAPEQSLQVAATCLSTALSAAAAAPPGASAAPASASGGPPSATSQLEAAVLVLTAVLQPLCDMAAGGLGISTGGSGQVQGSHAAVAAAAAAAAPSSPAAQAAAAGLVAGLADLLQAVLRVRLCDPRVMILHAEAIEAFGRFLALRPDLVAPAVSACLEVMALLPLEAPGQLPPPARQSPEWRAGFEARLAMANVLLGLARAAPSALVPHLSALVTQIAAMWERGLLREGERVLLWEGLLAASAAGPPVLQAQLVKLIFEPIAQQWASPEWQATVASPQAFISSYMPLTPSAGGGGPGPGGAGAAGPSGAAAGGSGSGYELGSRERRWTLYHQVTLLERAIRRTTPLEAARPAASTSGAAGGTPSLLSPSTSSNATSAAAVAAAAGGAAAAPSPDHPFAAHLEWCLPPVARIIACVHALADPRVRPLLGPLALVNELDPLERASRLGEDRDAVKAQEAAEPRCVAGGNLADARYFVRGVRECGYMVLSLAAAHCGAALWRSEQLAALLPAAVAGGAASLGDNVVRLLERHVLLVWAQRCPASRAAAWMVPLCSTFLPHMHQRLTSGWAAQASPNPAVEGAPVPGLTVPGLAGSGPGRPAGGAGAASASGAGGGGAGAAAAKSDGTTDEVVRDVLLRELTREHLLFLVALATRRPIDPATDPAGAAAAAAAGGGGLASAGSGGLSPRVSANGGPLPAASMAGMQECTLEVILRYSPATAQAGLVTGVTGLCWPDGDAAGKAVNFCRSLLGLAQSGHSELEGVVVGDVVRAAISSLGHVSTVMVQTQVLELLRSVLATYLAPRHPQSGLLRAVLAGLPGITPQVLDNFTTAFFGAHGDKEQRQLIKQLLAAVAGDEVRKLLAAVSRLSSSTGVSAVPEPKHRDRGPIPDITPQDMGLPHLFDLPDVL